MLRTENLQKSFGGLVAIDGVTISVEEGSITGLIGPNGAGKSTLFNLISGTIQPDDGKIYFNNSDITESPPHKIAKKGIGRTFQHARVFGEMTVEENLKTVPFPGEDVDTEVERILQLLELKHEQSSFANELSGGQQVLVGLARVLMLQPDLIMLDEPFAGVNPGLVEDIRDTLNRLREEEQVTIFIIDHEIDEMSEICDEVIVLAEGKKVTKNEPQVVQKDEQVIESYLGGAV